MDRFIEVFRHLIWYALLYLKSNMDRFIVFAMIDNNRKNSDLKSNMDRFIDKVIEDKIPYDKI